MKSVIVLDQTLGPGFLANAAACITSGLFSGQQDVLGPAVEGQYLRYIPITKIPILIMQKKEHRWKDLLKRARKIDLKYMLFTREGQSTTDYQEYAQRVEGKPIEEVSVIGIGVIGQDDLVNKFSGDLALLR